MPRENGRYTVDAAAKALSLLDAFSPETPALSLAQLIERTVQLTASIVGGTIYLDNGNSSISLAPTLLCQND